MDDEKEFVAAIQSLTLEDVNTVIQRYLSPENMTVIKVGDFASLKKEG